MTDLLQKNLIYLYNNKKELFEKIQHFLEVNQDKKCKLVYGEEGTINLSYALQDGVKLLYENNGSDIETWLQEHKYLKQGQYDIVMYGLGLTHHLAGLIRHNPQLNFYIIEPEIDIFIETLKVIEVDQLMTHNQVKLISVGNELAVFKNFHALLNTYSENAKIDVYIPYYVTLNLDDMRLFYDNNYAYREGQLIGLGFEKQFGTLPYRNSIRNLKKMYESTSVGALKNVFNGCTALIVGAGPSLEQDVEFISNSRDKLLIIAAGSSIQSLLHYKITPHLIVSMDPGEGNGRVFKHLDTSDIPIVFMPQIYGEILDNRFSNMFFGFFDSDPIINYLYDDFSLDYKFRATNSVTGTAIQIAKYLGAEKIAFTGQDLSFPNENYYAQGASHASKEQLKNTILTSQLEVENVNGTFNRTNLSMKSTLENIESLISTIEDVVFINTSSLGAKIKGADFVPFPQMISKMEKTMYNFDTLKYFTNEEVSNKLEYDDLINRVNKFIATSCILIDSCEQSLRTIRKIDELCRKQPNKAMNMIGKLEKEFSVITENTLFKMIITSWNRELTRKYDQQVIKIESEPTITGKSKLLNEIVVPYIKTIENSFNELKLEFEGLNVKLQSVK